MTALEQYSTERCIQCKSCTKVCPSARNGGVIPNVVIDDVNKGKIPENIWKCLQCHRCTDACPKGIEVSEIILRLRNASDDKPERFRKSFDTVLRNGRTMPQSNMIKAQREQLGLDADEVSQDTISKIQKFAEDGQ